MAVEFIAGGTANATNGLPVYYSGAGYVAAPGDLLVAYLIVRSGGITSASTLGLANEPMTRQSILGFTVPGTGGTWYQALYHAPVAAGQTGYAIGGTGTMRTVYGIFRGVDLSDPVITLTALSHVTYSTGLALPLAAGAYEHSLRIVPAHGFIADTPPTLIESPDMTNLVTPPVTSSSYTEQLFSQAAAAGSLPVATLAPTSSVRSLAYGDFLISSGILPALPGGGLSGPARGHRRRTRGTLHGLEDGAKRRKG